MTRFFALALLAAASLNPILANKIGQGLNFEEKRQVNLSVGVTIGTAESSTIIPSSQSTSVIVVTTASTVVVSPTGSPSVVVTTSTITRSSSTTAVPTSEVFSEVVTSSVQQTIITYITTRDGTTEIATSTGETTVPVTTSARVTTTALATGGDGNSSGLSESSKKIIGGVVGGIGGALLVGALAFTAWRIWGRKNKNVHGDDLYDPNMNADKFSHSTGDNRPFQSTLDQYHRPVNTASNF